MEHFSTGFSSDCCLVEIVFIAFVQVFFKLWNKANITQPLAEGSCRNLWTRVHFIFHPKIDRFSKTKQQKIMKMGWVRQGGVVKVILE